LYLEAQQIPYRKTEFNRALRQRLRGRTKASVELKHQNISAVLHSIDFPFIKGYKPRSNVQLLLRKVVQKYVLDNADQLRRIVDALEEIRPDGERAFKAVVVDPPAFEEVFPLAAASLSTRMPRKVDFASRDEANRKLGRAGEQWVLDFEQYRLTSTGAPELFQQVDWIADRLGDGAGYDILSYDTPKQPRYIEVKTTNGTHASAFIISRNELDFSKEAGDAFFLYRLFDFRNSPTLYILQGDVTKLLHLQPIDFRASFRRTVT